jgi:predicted O-methyltransferase YrrM
MSSTVSTTALCLALFAVTLGLLAVAALVLARKLRRLRRMLRRQERHVWETNNVFQVLRGGVPLPVPGGWAASSDLLGELLRAVAHRRPRRVVELGSGLSTLIIAAALRSNGAGRLISIDADRNYAAITRTELERQGLADWAEVRIAPLTESLFEGEVRPWYDTTVLADLSDIDLLLIDGPPTLLRADIRYPALPFFWPRLTAGAIALLDDAARSAERAIAQRWQRQFPDAEFEYLRLEKGALRVLKPGRLP